MSQLVLIGCGFLGSLFAEEFGKQCFAADVTVTVTCIDDDTVDHRNPANQGFTPADIDRPKAAVVAERLALYGLDTIERVTRVAADFTVDPDETLVIVSCVDTMATRTALWSSGRAGPVPVCQLGLSLDGTGTVEWTAPGWDTWSLSPMALGVQQVSDVPSGVTPPCQLVAMRFDGHAIAVAGAHAVAAYFGFPDPRRPDGAFGDLRSARTNRGAGIMWSDDMGVLVDAEARWGAADMVTAV